MLRIIASAVIAASVMAVPVWAESPPPFQEFTFKRVKPPKPGAKKRITVQVAPRANPAVPPPPLKAAVPVPDALEGQAASPARPRAAYDWYWTKVSPKQDDAGAARLTEALSALSKGPQGQSVAAPRLQVLQDIAQTYGIDILRASVGTRVSPPLALAVIAVESSGRKDAVSGAGAQGLMQLIPATAERFGVTDSFDPAQNIQGGIAYLDFLLEKFSNDPILTLAGYNAGENSIGQHGGVPPFAETRDYVPKVLAAYNAARALCMTPPELLTDGCVFRVVSR